MTAVGELITPTGRLVMSAEDMARGRDAWLAARRHSDSVPGGYCVGSSDVPSILDLEGVDTPVHVYHAKRSGYRTPVNDAMVWGHRLEAPIAEEWCARNRAVIDEIGLVAREGAPWHRSTIDRRVRECPVYKKRGEGTCALEVKNVGWASASRWRQDIPDRIYAQILHQLYTTGYEHIHYACLVGGNQMKQGIVYADRESEVMAYIVAEVDRFRTEHLIAGVEPAWDTSVKAAKLLEMDKAMHPDRVGEIGINALDDVLAYVEAQQAEAAAGKLKKQAAARLAQLAAGYEVITVAGQRAYWYGETGRTYVDLDKLAEKHPAAWDDPEVVRPSKTGKKSYTIHIDNQIKKML